MREYINYALYWLMIWVGIGIYCKYKIYELTFREELTSFPYWLSIILIALGIWLISELRCQK